MTQSGTTEERWTNIAIAISAVCLMVVAVAEAIGFHSTELRYAMLAGIIVSGTIVWIIQARKVCPHCGKRFGFSFRIFKTYQCRNCGGDIREGGG